MSNTALPPIPRVSPVVLEKTLTLGVDWLKWFGSLTYYVIRLLNKYESNKAGLATLFAGVAVVTNSNVLATSMIRLTPQLSSGTQGQLSVILNPGVGLTIVSSSNLDSSTIFYEIVEAF